MKQKGIYSLLLVGTLLFCGCGKKNESHNQNTDWKKSEALLLNSEKEMVQRDTVHSFFYFDTDGNPETAEEMLHIVSYSEETHLRNFNNAKIGTYLSLEEWEKSLCGKNDYIQWSGIHQSKIFAMPDRYREKE